MATDAHIVFAGEMSENGRTNLTVLSELFYERETEYFGMTPYALLDRIGSLIVDQYFDALSTLHSSTLPQNCPFLSETQVAAALTQWTLLVEGAIDKNFELFETYIMKNILALPSDFPIDAFLEEGQVTGGSREDCGFGTTADLALLDDSMQQTMRKLRMATAKNRRLKTELELTTRQETALQQLEGHMGAIRTLLQQHKIDSFERSMSVFVAELSALRHIVTETLAAGSNYLFAKYDADLAGESIGVSDTAGGQESGKWTMLNDAYRRILSEMAGLSAAQTTEQIELKRRQTASELAEKTRSATIADFEVRRAMGWEERRLKTDLFRVELSTVAAAHSPVEAATDVRVGKHVSRRLTPCK